jgi:hypothetical protein
VSEGGPEGLLRFLRLFLGWSRRPSELELDGWLLSLPALPELSPLPLAAVDSVPSFVDESDLVPESDWEAGAWLLGCSWPRGPAVEVDDLSWGSVLIKGEGPLPCPNRASRSVLSRRRILKTKGVRLGRISEKITFF